jgi:adenosylcobinamide-phosphate synthase
MTLERPVQLLVVLMIEAAVGYPQALYRTVRHPVVWVGNLIAVLEVRWNTGGDVRRRLTGCALLGVLVFVAGLCGWMLQEASEISPVAMVATLLMGTSLLAQRSLHDHVSAVLRPLQSGDVAAARRSVSQIVGRDTATLDAPGISTAAIESLAESFCDGIVAPVFWFLVAGWPGLLICKAVNTADSMVGHRDERHRAFGWATARADDVVNLVPARIAGLLICAAGFGGVRTMFRDAHLHASPNGGWPEAAMAGVLARQLGGAVSYEGEPAFRATLGIGPRPDTESLRAALSVYWRACLMLWILVAGVAWLL